MHVLGIDPGLQRTGWGVIAVDGPVLRHVANGVCAPGSGGLAERLLALYRALAEVVAAHAPVAAAVESAFVSRDPGGALKLGQARGIALLVPAAAGIAVAEYAPNAVKKAVVGVGHAEKAQVEHMVRMQLPGAVITGPDAADALAVAICHARHLGTARRLQAALARAHA
jgi:crossover junction endodeoxyribonuclease RuvC